MCTVETSKCRFSNTALIHVSFVKMKIKNVGVPSMVPCVRVNKKQKIVLLLWKK